MKKQMKTKENIHNLEKTDGSTTTNDKEKAEELLRQFSSVFTIETDDPPVFPERTEARQTDIMCQLNDFNMTASIK